ncbi:unnamed protein product, partial [Protopolystoma xenopodis]
MYPLLQRPVLVCLCRLEIKIGLLLSLRFLATLKRSSDRSTNSLSLLLPLWGTRCSFASLGHFDCTLYCGSGFAPDRMHHQRSCRPLQIREACS